MGSPDAQAAGDTTRSRTLVVVIAVSRLLKGVALLVLGALEVRILDSDAARDRLLALVDRLGIDPGQPRIDHLVERLLAIGGGHLRAYEIGTFVYAALFLTEGFGLLRGWRWAEWLVVASTALLIPFEAWQVVASRRWDHAWIIALNIAVAAFLFVHVRHRLRAHAATSAPAVSG